MLQFPVNEDALGRRVNIIGGILSGRSGHLAALSDEPQAASIMVEVDGDGGKVWIESDHLEEEPLRVTTDRPKGCPFCLRPTITEDGAVYIEEGAYNGRDSYEAEGDAPRYRCTSEGCGLSFVVW